MNKAEQRANEAYPYKEGNVEYDRELVEETQCYYVEGYLQAIKDIVDEVERRKRENQWSETDGADERFSEDCYILSLIEFMKKEN